MCPQCPTAYFLGFFSLFFGTTLFAADFSDEVERDFPLKYIGQLHVTNMRGDVVVEGWAHDKIRVKARRRVVAENEDEARKLFSTLDFRYRSVDGSDIELSAEYGRGLDIQARLKERENPKTKMEMIVFAPGNLKLKVSTVDGSASVKSWNAAAEIRTASGPISVKEVRSSSLSLLCPSCNMKIEATKSSVRCMGGTGQIDMNGVSGANIYAETSSGALNVENVKGDQLYVSSSGAVRGKRLDGRVEFHAQTSSVSIAETAGFLSGRTTSGSISAQMNEWKFSDKALIESESGNITLALPISFSGDVDIWSAEGKTDVSFPVRKSEEAAAGPRPAGRFYGKVRDGGELLKVYSKSGNVSVLRGSAAILSK